MSFDSRFFAVAQTELSELKARNARLYEERKREIQIKHPDIADMDKKLAMTGARLIYLVSDRSENISERLNALEKENTELQSKIRLMLKQNGYPENYLDMPYSCNICRDTGIAEGKRCGCFMKMVRKAAMKELNDSSPLSLCSFDDFDLKYYDDSAKTKLGCTAREAMSNNFMRCIQYAQDFHLPYDGLLMQGNTGLGKTHLSLSIAAKVMERGYSAVYGSAPDLFRKIEKEHFSSDASDGTMEQIQSADLLVLDDIGAEFDSKFYISAFYNIINNRMNTSAPTIVSTNLEASELKNRYGDRITSRLMTMERIIFVGSDVRVRKLKK